MFTLKGRDHMRIERGSEWNIWDFHVHTPYSRLNTTFGIDLTRRDSEKDFDNYVKTLFTKAVDKGVVAIGITDYFFIDGYKRIRQEYLSKSDKMKSLFPEDELREQVMGIFVFPNIEFRLNTFVGVECHSVNYHVFFSDKINITDIEDNFLRRLNVFLEPNAPLTLTQANVRNLGHEYKIHNPEEHRDDFIVGLEKITIDDSQIFKILSGNSIFQNRYFISVPVNEKLCKLPWNGRDYFPKRSLYQQCNMLMSPNEKTRQWALGKGGREQKQIEEFGGLKPCIWGSDAHSYEELFSPAKDRFCWIKAEPTFEGLRQIICEPEERVRIQFAKPEQKNEHQIIDHVIFKSPQIISTPIYLNEGLNAIIGGKSTGKSIFLRNIARQLDPEQVDERESLVSPEREKMDVDDVGVYWKDGVSDKRKIIYIPQSWLNRVVDDDSGDSQLNDMIEKLLLQQDEIAKAHTRLKARIAEITTETRKNIIDYVAAREKVQDCEKKLRETGGSEAYRATIERLESSRQSFSAEMKITEEQLKKYIELEKSIAEKNDRVQKIIQEAESLSAEVVPFVIVPGFTAFENDNKPKYNFEGMQITGEQLKRIVGQMNEQISKTWLSAIPTLKEKLAQEEKDICDKLSPLQEEYQKLKELISRSDEIKKIESQLAGEKIKLKEVIDVEEAKKENEFKTDALKQKILGSRQSIRTEYENFISIVLSVVENLNTNLQFDVEIVAAREEFADTVENLFDKRKSRSFKDKYGYDAFNSNLKITDKLFEDLWDAMIGGVLVFKGANTVQNALERLFSDWFHVHYIVKSGDDTINRMSQGKKALVLLEMIVNLDNNNCPLLIDQPEDDLDNRSIYNELVQYLRKKKQERQIIVVTHNANVVVGADAEEVIIANQAGDDTPNYSKQFEYRCGAIENVSPIYGDDGEILRGVLNQKGIQEQICDILEGGKEAFELRQRKYLLG